MQWDYSRFKRVQGKCAYGIESSGIQEKLRGFWSTARAIQVREEIEKNPKVKYSIETPYKQ